MKTKTFSLIFIVGVSLSFLYQYKFSITPIYKIPKILSSMRAKEFCSCYFLLSNSKPYCLEKVAKGYSLFDYKINKDSITFSNPVATSTAFMRSKKLGCTLSK